MQSWIMRKKILGLILIEIDNKTITSKDISFNTDYDNKFSSTSFSTFIYYKIDHVLRFTYSGAFHEFF